MARKWRYFEAHPNERVKIDASDYDRVSQKAWRVTVGTTGRRRVVTSVRTQQGVRSLTLGAFLMRPPKGKQVYPRRFNDELDYRKGNLVVCTLAERQRLLPKKRSKTSSRYRGVSLSRQSGLWRAGIEVDGRSINLGEFKNEEQAAQAYNRAARKHFGLLAYQNQFRATSDRRKR